MDITSDLKADPKKAAQLAESISSWPNNSTQQLKAVQDKLKALVASGQLGIFANGYWGHPAMKLPPEVNLLATAHYLQALDYQRKANQIVSILGSKTPHVANLVPGGVSTAINLDSPSALNMERLYYIKTLIDDVGGFVKNVHLPDVCAVGAMYADWTKYGAGVTNYLSVPDMPMDTTGTVFNLPGGYIANAGIKSYKPVTSYHDDYFREGVKESIKHSWYKGDWAKHPYDESTDLNYTGLKDDGKYSWVKAPSFYDQPAQVGPLILLRDEGIGIRAIRALEARYPALPGIEIVDGGTAGLDLLPYFEGRDRVLFVDAVNFRKEPGYIGVLENQEIPTLFSCKDSMLHLGLVDVLATAQILDVAPRESASLVSSPTSSQPVWNSLNFYKKNCPCCWLPSSPNYRLGGGRNNQRQRSFSS